MKELLPRERFTTRALRHEPVDRVPLLYRMKHEAKEKLARVYGITDAGTGRKHNPALELRLGNDAIIYQIGINADFSHRPIAIGETWFNHFGVGYGKSGLKGRTPGGAGGVREDPGVLGAGQGGAGELPQASSHHVAGGVQELRVARSRGPGDARPDQGHLRPVPGRLLHHRRSVLDPDRGRPTRTSSAPRTSSSTCSISPS